MIKTSWLLGSMFWGAAILAAGPAPGVRGPFGALEADLRKEVARATAAWHQAEAAGRPALESALKAAYEGLHDIRHHQAFGELWAGWAFKGDILSVLYPASGAHLAPLEIVHKGRLREAVFTYTEIDPSMIPRLEANLLRLSNLGFYDGLAVSITPLPPRPGEHSLPPPPQGGTERIQAWIRDSIAATGTAPPMEVAFTFRYRETGVRLRFLLKAFSEAPGSTEFFRAEDLEGADLVVTHDISFDPREHLAFLRSCMESSLARGRTRPLMVMMEDLARHPARLDPTPFGVRAATSRPYGHAAYLDLPDGTRTETEDGPTLYEGAVLLQPDLAQWRALTPPERAALFNLVLLRDHGFDRRNADLTQGRRVEAPAILDWHMGYGHKDIDGRDLRGRKGFLPDLAGACASAVGHIPMGPLKGWLCASLVAFRTTLERIASRDGLTAAREAALVPAGHPFLSTPETRRQFQAAVAGAGAVGAQLQADAEEAGSAAGVLARGRLRKEGCLTRPEAPAEPTLKKVRP